MQPQVQYSTKPGTNQGIKIDQLFVYLNVIAKGSPTVYNAWHDFEIERFTKLIKNLSKNMSKTWSGDYAWTRLTVTPYLRNKKYCQNVLP